MRPRWHFVAHTVVIIIGGTLLILFVLYCISLALLVLHRGKPLLAFILLTVSILGVWAIEALVKKYPFAYRKPLVYSLIAVAVFVVLLSFVLERVHLQEQLLTRARQNRLPVFGPVYRHRFVAPQERPLYPQP